MARTHTTRWAPLAACVLEALSGWSGSQQEEGNGDTYSIRLAGVSGVSQVPEPGAVAFGTILFGGLGGMVLRARRRVK